MSIRSTFNKNFKSGGEKMRKQSRYIMLSLLSVCILMMSINGVLATKPVHVSATGSALIIPTPEKFAGGNIFFSAIGEGSYTGDLEGTTYGIHQWHMNKDGTIAMTIQLVFTGWVLGEYGSITMHCVGKVGGTVTWTIISGTDDLANLKGVGTLGPGWFDGYVHFDPK